MATQEEQALKAKLESLGVQVREDRGVSGTAETLYVLRYSFMQVSAPTLNLALLAFVERLLLMVPVERTI